MIRLRTRKFIEKIDSVFGPLKDLGSGKVVIEFDPGDFEKMEIVKRQDGSTLVAIPFTYGGANVLRTALIGSYRKILERKVGYEARKRLAVSIANGMLRELSEEEES